MYKNSHYFFIGVFVVTVIGFFPSYFGQFSKAPGHHHIHGLISTSWFLLLIAQGFFLAKKKISWHRLSGRISPLFALAVFASTIWIMRRSIARDLVDLPELFVKVYFLDWILVPMFMVTYLCAIYFRKKVQIHQRCMVLTLLPLTGAVILRIIFYYILEPLGYGFEAIWHPYVLVTIAILAMAIYDDRRRGHIYWPYPSAFSLVVLIYLTSFFVHRMPFVTDFLNWTAL